MPFVFLIGSSTYPDDSNGMKIKPIYNYIFFSIVLIAVFLFDSGRFVVSHYGRSLDIIPTWVTVTRDLFLLTILISFFAYQLYSKPNKKPNLISNAWVVIISCLIFLGVSHLLSLVTNEADFDRTGGVDNNNWVLIPTSYLTIVKVHVFGIVLFIFSVYVWLYLRNFIYFKRSKTIVRYYLLAVALTVIASLSAYLGSNDPMFISMILVSFAVTVIVINSFRLSWVLYVSKKEKISGIFLIIVLITVVSLLYGFLNKDLLDYYSPAVGYFVQLTFLFLITFSSISFFSLLFHLPTSEAFERKTSELSSIHNLSRLISDVFDLKDLSSAMVGYSIQSVNADFAWVELFTEGKEKTHHLRIFAYKGIEFDNIEQLTTSTLENLHQRIYSHPQILVIDKARESNLLNQDEVIKNKMGSLVVVPLIARGELVGCLFVGKNIAYGFDKEDLDTINTFADQSAIAIDNSRLIEKSLEKERLQQELQIAQKMQMKLLPQTTPVFENLQVESVSYPAYEVGGDYYDFIHLPNGNFGVIVADVSGKGTSAAFYMAEVKGIFQSLARIFLSPKKLLIEANNTLFGSMEKKSFVSLLYAIIDTTSGLVTFSRAGHCPLLLVKHSGEFSFLKSKGIGIGLTKSSILENSLEEVSIQLEEGDVCLLFSDGVVEAMNAELEEFGYERLGQLVGENNGKTAAEILQIVINEINNFIFEGRANDDLTLVVTKWVKNK